MEQVEIIHETWLSGQATLLQGEFFRRLNEGALSPKHYRTLMREIYHNTRNHPQHFALMAAKLTGNKRQAAKNIFRHCIAEWGHDQLALDDFQAMGGDATQVIDARPLPTTMAMSAFSMYLVHHDNPLGYLGYVYHLEMLAAASGSGILTSLDRIGIPDTAMTFIREHAKVDPHHVHWLNEYFLATIETPEDLEAILYGLNGTARLHALFFEGILEEGDSMTPMMRAYEHPVAVQAR
jgi:pyrroloquinoline quinone (PQQ) biosynthesis protein C